MVNFQQTVNLPKTDFAMRANAPVREPEIQQFWQDARIYETLAQRPSAQTFILHDGPPYANGSLHVGHALNKILKDTINRYQMLRGRRVNYVPGWDCHGLPIELKVLQNLKPAERQGLTPLALRHRARDFALAAVEEQKAGFQRYGVWGDWSHPYLTLRPEYEAAQLAAFGAMALKGYIYRALKPVYWSPSSRTALAEAELEYPEEHVSRSIYVAFAVDETQAGGNTALTDFLGDYRATARDNSPVSIAIWTTTPWTIPGNLAVCLGPGIQYSVVKTASHGLIVAATDLVKQLEKALGETVTLVREETIPGLKLEHTICKHPLYNRPAPVLLGDHVTTESGTGAVHTAPGHGADDFNVGQHYHLGILSPVDDLGNFTPEVEEGYTAPGEPLTGKNVLGEGNKAVIQALSAVGALLKEEDYAHKYPYDWRTKKPVIVRATTQWFASVEKFREQALEAIRGVRWVPAAGENRITAMVAERSDWCISRQRAWGVPIPVFYCTHCHAPLILEQSLQAVQDLVRVYGSDGWWERESSEILPPGTSCPTCSSTHFTKETDIMDVWFDSGSSWAAVLGTRPELEVPADLYLEGSDQHRGWFQSSLLTATAVRGHAPYKSVITHGFVLDENGRKMSKSLGNVVDPQGVIKQYGADVLRLWVSSVDYTTDVRLGQTILSQQADIYRKIRNTARYLLGNLYDFNPTLDIIAYEDLPDLERYMLHRLQEVIQEVTEAFEKYQFFRFFQTVQNFCVVDLSNFYLDIAKDTLYTSTTRGLRRRSTQTVLYHVLDTLTRLIAPVLCHLAEDIWQYLPYTPEHKSVFLAGWPEVPETWHNPGFVDEWKQLRSLRNSVLYKLEKARSEKLIGSSLEAKIVLNCEQEEHYQRLKSHEANLRYLFIVSQVELRLVEAVGDLSGHDTSLLVEPELSVLVEEADGEKCPRCWNYSTHIGESPLHPGVCERCAEALEGTF
nr:isoleucine--tRNA ligase [Anthocerotibacter panamensis]